MMQALKYWLVILSLSVSTWLAAKPVKAINRLPADSIVFRLKNGSIQEVTKDYLRFLQDKSKYDENESLLIHRAYADYFARNQAPKFSLRHAKAALAVLAKKANDDANLQARFEITLLLAQQYERSAMPDSALIMYTQAQRQAEVTRKSNNTYIANFELGKTLFNVRNWNKAQECLSVAAASPSAPDSGRVAGILAGLANYELNRDFPSLLKLEQAYPPVDSISIFLHCEVAKLLLKSNLNFTSQTLLDSLSSISVRHPNWQKQIDFIRLGYFLKQSGIKEAKQYWIELDSISKQTGQQATNDPFWEMATTLYFENPVPKKTPIERKKSINPIFILYIGGVLILVLILAIVLASVLTRKKRAVEEHWLEVSRAKAGLGSFEPPSHVLVTEANRTVLKGVLDKLSEIIKSEDHSTMKETTTSLLMTLEDLLNENMIPANLIANIAHLDNGFESRLHEAYPNLNERERLYCHMVKLNFSPVEIAGLLNISFESAEEGIKNLGQTLHLKPGEDIYIFIANL